MKLPRRIAFSLNSSNQRSTKLSQLELVGTKWQTKRGCFLSQAFYVRLFVGAVVVHNQVQFLFAGKFPVQPAQKF